VLTTGTMTSAANRASKPMVIPFLRIHTSS
jgi:hypothetical protein